MGLVWVRYGFSMGSKKQTPVSEQKRMFSLKFCNNRGLEANPWFLKGLVA